MNPVQVTFKEVDASPALRDRIETLCQRLKRYAPDIVSCEVVVSRTESRHQKGNRYLAHMRVTLPGREVNAGHAKQPDHTHEDPFVAVRDTYRAMRRQLQDHERRRRWKVKRHEEPALARVESLDQGRGIGMLATDDGREIFFHQNSVVDLPFRKVRVGDRVRFVEAAGEDGPSASTVHVLSHKHR